IGQVLVGEVLAAVGGHVLARAARLVLEAGPRKGIRRELRPGAALAALTDRAVAGVALVLEERLVAASSRAGGVLCKSISRREKKKRQQLLHHRPWETTSTRAGSPRFTAASARASPGPIAAGSLIGPSAYPPCAC